MPSSSSLYLGRYSFAAGIRTSEAGVERGGGFAGSMKEALEKPIIETELQLHC